MAESLAIIGLVSAIVQLVDFGTKIVARLDDFEKAVGSVPEAFRDIHTQLPLLLNNLKKTKEQAKARELDEDAKKAVLAVVDNCQNGLQSLEKILVKSLPAANESISRKIGKAISSVRREKRVQDIAKKLRDNAIYLTQYTVVHIADGGRRLPNPSNMCPFAREDSFVGRKGILEDISRKHKVYKRLAIIGLAGVGKSRVAIEYSYRLRIPDPAIWVFWVHCTSQERIIQSYADIGRRVNIPGIDRPAVEVCQLVVEWLRGNESGRWLLVLDNMDDAKTLRSRYIPHSSQGTVLLTSRNREVALSFCETERAIIQLSPMEKIEAIRFFSIRLPEDPSSDDDKALLVSELCYLPLAIKQAVAYIRVQSPEMTISKYLENLQEGDDKRCHLLSKETPDLSRDDEVENSIIITLQISLKQIQRDSPRAADLLSLMCMFDRQSIPRTILRRDNEDKTGLSESLAVLMNFSLITAEIGGELFGMHRLVQLAMRTWLVSNGEQTLWRRTAVAVISAAFAHPDKNCAWRYRSQALYPHAQAILSWEFQNPGDSIKFAELVTRIGWYDYLRGRTKEAQVLLSQGVTVYENYRAPTESFVVLKRTLGMVLCGQGRHHEAKSIVKESLEAARTNLGAKHLETLHTFMILGQCLKLSGSHKDAESILWTTLTLQREIFGFENPYTLATATELIELLLITSHDDERKLFQAQDLQQATMGAVLRVRGPDDQETLRCELHYVELLYRKGEYSEAETSGRRLYEKHVNLFGPSHVDTIRSSSRLAQHMYQQSRFRDAEDLYRRNVDELLKVSGWDDIYVCNQARKLADVLLKQDKFDHSVRIRRRILKARRKMQGYCPILALETAVELAAVLQANSSGINAEAKGLLQEVLQECDHELDHCRGWTWSEKKKFVSLLHYLGKFQEANKIERELAAVHIDRNTPNFGHEAIDLVVSRKVSQGRTKSLTTVPWLSTTPPILRERISELEDIDLSL